MSRIALSNHPLGENSNRENMKENQRTKLGKAGGKRSVLGNVTNNVRVQPVRAAKDKHTVLQGFKASGQENAGVGLQKKASSSTFSIFQDVTAVPKAVARVPPIVHEPMLDQENMAPSFSKHEAVVGLNRGVSIKPLKPLSINVEPINVSPMAVDSPRDVKSTQRDEYGLDPYYDDIYKYLRLIEKSGRPAQNYMCRQTDVTTSMRNILVDWLVEVGEEYKLHRETLFLAISYIDKFLSLVGVHRPKLQLVGTACMFIAAKYEEIYPPDVAEFVYITDDTYTRNQVLKMETVILKLLDFRVALPTINWFCERFMAPLDLDEKTKNLAFFLCELSLIEIEEFLQFSSSKLAASALALAHHTTGSSEAWPSEVIEVSKYSHADLRDCIMALHRLHRRASSMPQQAVIEKYKTQKYSKASQVAPRDVLNL